MRPSPAAWAASACIVTAVAVGSFIGSTAELSALVKYLSVDDSFYYLEIARNVASTGFSSFDGVNATNGYHPLWMLVEAGLFQLRDDPVVGLRLAKATELILLGLAAAITVLGARAAQVCWYAFPLLLLAALRDTGLYNGMESAIHLLTLTGAGVSFALCASAPRSRARFAASCVLLALLPWSRLESVAVALALPCLGAVMPALREAWPRRRLLAAWGAVLASLAAYLAWNQLVFHSPVPISGRHKELWSMQKWAAEGGFDWRSSWSAQLGLEHAISLQRLAVAVFGLILASWLVPAYRHQRQLRGHHAFDACLVALVAASVARLGYATARAHPYFSSYTWYFVPATLGWLLFWPVAVARLWDLSRPARPAMRRAARLAAVALALFWMRSTRVDQLPSQMRFIVAPATDDWELASLEGAAWIDANLPADAVVGSTDAGALGFFSARRVINLDGLVNSTAYYEASRAGEAAQWAVDAGITHFANVVRSHIVDGCKVLRTRTRSQRRADAGCRLLHEGTPFEGGERVFRVWAIER